MKKHMAKFLVFLLMFGSLAIHIPALEVQAADQAEAIVAVAKSQLGVKERSILNLRLCKMLQPFILHPEVFLSLHQILLG